jgi:hypothetical protein
VPSPPEPATDAAQPKSNVRKILDTTQEPSPLEPVTGAAQPKPNVRESLDTTPTNSSRAASSCCMLAQRTSPSQLRCGLLFDVCDRRHGCTVECRHLLAA